MRVLAVTNAYPSASHPESGIFIEQQVSGLRRIGVDVQILFLDRVTRGIRVYWELARKLRREVEAHGPDLVHAMYGGVMAWICTQAATSVPVVVTFHGSDLLGEHLSGLARRWVAGFGVACSRKAARRASGIVLVSKTLNKDLPLDIDPAKVRVIPCGIDLQRFRVLDRMECRKKLGWKFGGFHLLFPANSGNPVKRPELAQATIRQLESRGFPCELHALQGVDNAEVPFWLNASDAVLLTSLHEGSPMIVKEALACDVPVVSVDVGDVRERIQDVEGCYLALAEPAALAEKLAMVLSGTRRVAGRDQVRELSLEIVALRLIDFYQAILDPPFAEGLGKGRHEALVDEI